MLAKTFLFFLDERQRMIAIQMSGEDAGLIAEVFHDRPEVIFVAQMDIFTLFRIFDHFG